MKKNKLGQERRKVQVNRLRNVTSRVWSTNLMQIRV